MNDRYKFRGKRVDNGEWVYGYYAKYEELENGQWVDVFIIIDEVITFEVILSTVGQYTGLHDKNGVEIYEGMCINFNGEYCPVKYGEFNFSACDEYSCSRTGYYIEISIGAYVTDNTGLPLENVCRDFEAHDNPELLGEEE